jgi:hypothetical protein
VEFRYGESGEPHWVPDWEDPLFLKAHFRLIRALGQRYDGHPDLELALALAIVDPRTQQPAVRLAIRGRAADGWHPLGPVEVRAAR